MNNHLKCGSCKNMFNTGKRMPIQLPCFGQDCTNRSACKECVQTKILANQNEDGTYKCCYSELHIIASDFKIVSEFSIHKQLLERKELTIKCRIHEDLYIEDYCHKCRELICFRCFPEHKKHIKSQGGNSKFTPERFTKYLMFVRPKLEDIASQINQTIELFNNTLSCEEEYYARQVMEGIVFSFDLLKHRFPDQEDMLHPHNQHYDNQITPDPQNMHNMTNQEEIKQDSAVDQQVNQNDYNSLYSRLQSLELKQLFCNDSINTFIEKTNKERQREQDESFQFQNRLIQKIDKSISEIAHDQLQKLDTQLNAFSEKIKQSKEEQDKVIETKIESFQNQQTLAIEQFQTQTDNDIKNQLDKFEIELTQFKDNINSTTQSIKQDQEFLNIKQSEIESQIKQVDTNQNEIEIKIQKELETLKSQIDLESKERKDIKLNCDKQQNHFQQQMEMIYLETEVQQVFKNSYSMMKFKKLVNEEINKTSKSLLKGDISDYSTKQYELLFCGSNDGFSSYKFHELCDNQGPTVTFILSEYGLVFGGYASIPWTSPNGQWYSDSSAFVFSLSKRSIHKQYRIKHQAVWHHKDYMCAFGFDDIGIRDNCDSNSGSYCNLGGTYELPHGYELKSNESKSYLAGYWKFKVLEIQVYSFK
eukprot:403356509